MKITLKREGIPPHWQTLLFGHGWIALAPFSAIPFQPVFTRTLRTGKTWLGTIRYDFSVPGRIQISAGSKSAEKHKRAIVKSAERMFRIGEDFSGFQKVFAKDKGLRMVVGLGAGPLLRSPTVFEDVVKTICTTNCSWSNTRLMCKRLCALTHGYFPTPEEIARLGVENLTRDVRAGYRAGYLHEFAVRVADGDIDPESWVKDAASPAVEQAVASIRGAGSYAQNHILFLLGNYSRIPVDSEVTKWVSENIFGGRPVAEREIQQHFESYGAWKFLVYRLKRILSNDKFTTPAVASAEPANHP